MFSTLALPINVKIFKFLSLNHMITPAGLKILKKYFGEMLYLRQQH